MVMLAEPLAKTFKRVRNTRGSSRVIYLSPQGKRLEQGRIRELAALPALTLLAGRYEGIDERLLEQEVEEEISIGDYVLAGG
jgi:tRNA (guanine37-N1)-methyltransferase